MMPFADITPYRFQTSSSRWTRNGFRKLKTLPPKANAMNWCFKLGRMMGISVNIHWTFLIFFANTEVRSSCTGGER
ncbi:MAG: hypothetical protein GY903_19865 [Fuerstiella sp.]|nr:hypothetical protein [Fuerstiella sp.]MCP4856745.1 hypothetical protein [Fuerstiella sp.]